MSDKSTDTRSEVMGEYEVAEERYTDPATPGTANRDVPPGGGSKVRMTLNAKNPPKHVNFKVDVRAQERVRRVADLNRKLRGERSP